MEVNVKDFRDNLHVIEVSADDTAEKVRQKVATAVGLPQDSFLMSFGEKVMGEGADMTQLSAGDTIVVTQKKKDKAVAALRALGETDITEERLWEVAEEKNAQLACLFLQAEVTTVVPEFFLSDSSSYEVETTLLTRLDLSEELIVTRIEEGFLQESQELTEVDLSGLCNVTDIACYFLQDCRSLTALDLSALCNVTQIGGDFLEACTSLTTVDLSGFRNLAAIGTQFLSGCSSLKTLDLSALRSVKSIGPYFLQICSSLTTVNLSGFCVVEEMPATSSLVGCKSLTALDLSGCSAAVYRALESGEHSALVSASSASRKKRSRDEASDTPSVGQATPSTFGRKRIKPAGGWQCEKCGARKTVKGVGFSYKSLYAHRSKCRNVPRR